MVIQNSFKHSTLLLGKKTMGKERLLFGLVQLLECIEFESSLFENPSGSTAPVAVESEANSLIVDILWDTLFRCWEDVVDGEGRPLLGDQNTMMPEAAEPVQQFVDAVFGSQWESTLRKMKTLASLYTSEPASRLTVAGEASRQTVGMPSLLELGTVVNKSRTHDDAVTAKITVRAKEIEVKIGRDEMNRVTSTLPRLFKRANADSRKVLRTMLLGELFSGRGVYAEYGSESGPAAQQFWKLDRMELPGSSRMRVRLKPNHAGSQHLAARYRDPEAEAEAAALAEAVGQAAAGPLNGALPSDTDCENGASQRAVKEVGAVAVDCVWENQGYSISAGFDQAHLLPTDRGAWTDSAGKPLASPWQWAAPAAAAPGEEGDAAGVQWRWLSEWFIDTALAGGAGDLAAPDGGGWLYASNFPAITGWRAQKTVLCRVRRRRWIRLRQNQQAVAGGLEDGADSAGVGVEKAMHPEPAGLLREHLARHPGTLGGGEDGGLEGQAHRLTMPGNFEGSRMTLSLENLSRMASMETGGGQEAATTVLPLEELAEKLEYDDHMLEELMAALEDDEAAVIEWLQNRLASQEALERDSSRAGSSEAGGSERAPSQQGDATFDAEDDVVVEQPDLWERDDDAAAGALQESRDDSAGYNVEVPEHVFGCEWVTPMKAVLGCFSLTGISMYFTPFDGGKEQRWPYRSIKELYRRRYLLQPTGLEFRFADRTSAFINFPLPGDNKSVFDKVMAVKPPLPIRRPSFANPAADLDKYTAMWVNGHLPNFQYLMALNTLSGRTYNDLTQVTDWGCIAQVVLCRCGRASAHTSLAGRTVRC